MFTFIRRTRFGLLAFALIGAIGLSAAPAQASGTYAGWDGSRVKAADNPAVYLVVCGSRRWIPNPATYENLFVDWNGIVVTDVNSIPRGYDLSDGSALAKGPSTDATFLISNGVKRWITSPAVFDQYHFAWSKIRIVDQAWLDGLPSACNLD